MREPHQITVITPRSGPRYFIPGGRLAAMRGEMLAHLRDPPAGEFGGTAETQLPDPAHRLRAGQPLAERDPRAPG